MWMIVNRVPASDLGTVETMGVCAHGPWLESQQAGLYRAEQTVKRSSL